MTELAENNAALEAEETNGAEAIEATEAQDDTTQNQDAAPVSENVAGETGDQAAGESTPAAESAASDAAASEEAPEANLPARDADGFSVSAPEEGVQRKHVAGGVGYEVIFAVRTGDQQLVEDSSERVRALIEGTCEGAVDNVRASEVRRFAYPIKKQAEGVYVVVNARFKPEYTGELERFFKLDENVLRHMLLKEDR